jgi:hypothetical protein
MTGHERLSTDSILIKLCGSTLASAEAYESGWSFRFSNGASVTTQSIWRALTAHGIAITSEDHHQRFGLPEPVDAAQRAASTLLGEVTQVTLAPVTSDLRISFDSETTLEFLNTSCGYEGWHLVAREGEQRALEIVALGGGDVTMWSST